MAHLRLIGYWRSADPRRADETAKWPDPVKFVDEDWDPRERSLVATYLSSGMIPWAGAGFSPCRLCDKPNGSCEYTDGVYVWPEGLSHYVQDHAVRLPREVIDHILAQVDEYDFAFEQVDRDWWQQVTSEPNAL
jgi:hypothetical protein